MALLRGLWCGLQCVIVVYPDYTHLHFYNVLSVRVISGYNLKVLMSSVVLQLTFYKGYKRLQS